MKQDNKCKISRGVQFLCIGSNKIIFNCRDGSRFIHIGGVMIIVVVIIFFMIAVITVLNKTAVHRIISRRT
jgi:hypothetical protein